MSDRLTPLETKSKIQLKLTEDEIVLLRQSWSATSSSKQRGKALLSSRSSPNQSTSAMFGSTHFWIRVYEDLISKHPLILEFLPSIKHQTVQFASIMLMAVENLEDLSTMSMFLQKLGCMHVRMFCVEPAYFQHMGNSLHDVLVERLTNLKVIDLWMKLFCYLANSMMIAGDVKILNEHLVSVANQVTFYDEDTEQKEIAAAAAVAQQQQQQQQQQLQKTLGHRESKNLGNIAHRRTTLTVDSTDTSSIHSNSTANTVVSSDWSSNENLAKIQTQAPPATIPKVPIANPPMSPPSPTPTTMKAKSNPTMSFGKRLFGRANNHHNANKPLLRMGGLV